MFLFNPVVVLTCTLHCAEYAPDYVASARVSLALTWVDDNLLLRYVLSSEPVMEGAMPEDGAEVEDARRYACCKARLAETRPSPFDHCRHLHARYV